MLAQMPDHPVPLRGPPLLEKEGRSASPRLSREARSAEGRGWCAQDRTLVEHYSRQPGDLWLLRAASRLGDRVRVDALGRELLLTEIYLNVEGLQAA